MNLNSGVKLLIILFIQLALLPQHIFSQVNQEWLSNLDIFDGNETLVKKMTVDAEGNVYVIGSCPVPSHGKDFVTVKYNSSGIEQWASYYNGTDSLNDGANCIYVDDAGNVFVGGSSYSPNNLSDFLLIKYNSTGGELWTKRYDGPGHLDDGINDLAVDIQGNVYVTGGSWGIPGGLNGTYLDYATIKYSSNGSQQWVNRYNGNDSSWDESYKLGLDGNGDLIVTGYSMEISGQSDDFTTIKYNSSGSILWVKHFDGPYHTGDQAKSLLIDKNNNIYVMGFTPTTTDYDYAVVKYNSLGVEKWTAIYDGIASGWDYPIEISGDTSGNVYVSGVSNGVGTNEDYLTVKFDSLGIFKWAARYNNSYNGADRLEAMTTDVSGNVYVTGYSLGGPMTFNYLTIKYNTLGEQQWIKQFHDKRYIAEYGRAIAVDKNNNVYVSGYTFGNIPDDNIVTIKYSQKTSVNDPASIIKNGFALHQNYPNPFNPKTIITYNIPVSAGNIPYKVILKIYDVLGNEVATLLNKQQGPGSYSVEFDASQLSSGIYFYRIAVHSDEIEAGDFSEVKKMTLLK